MALGLQHRKIPLRHSQHSSSTSLRNGFNPNGFGTANAFIFKYASSRIIYAFVITFVVFYIFFLPETNTVHEYKTEHDNNNNNVDEQQTVPRLLVVETTDGPSCQYDGHCPVGYSCAVPSSPSKDTNIGICESIPINQKPQQNVIASKVLKNCLETCHEELILDEHYYHEFAIDIKDTYAVQSKGRPDGCLIQYTRQTQRDPDLTKKLDDMDAKNPHPSYESPEQISYWLKKRFRHIKRVDPIGEGTVWTAYCTNGCQSDSECVTSNDKNGIPGFGCVDGACQRNDKFWVDKEESKMVIVTGATEGYYSGLANLIGSAQYWAPNNPVVVYNLGDLSAERVKTLRDMTNVLSVEWADGIPQQYAAHLGEAKAYAWKPIIINETVHKYKQIFWLDAGNTLAGPITPVEQIVRRIGSALMKGQDLDMERTHEGTYKWFGYEKGTFVGGPHFSGNTQAYMYPSRYIDTIVKPMAVCALEKQCIMPEGSHLGNHRYDQTVLSILSYNFSVRAPHFTEYLAATNNQLQMDLSKPSVRFVWTARQGCQFYAEQYLKYKSDLKKEGN